MLVIFSSLAFVLTFASDIPTRTILDFAVVGPLIVLASSLHIKNPGGGVLSSSLVLLYATIYLFDPLSGLILGGTAYAVGNSLPRRWVTWRACGNAALMGLSIAAGSVVFRGLGGDLKLPISLQSIMPALPASVAHQLTNNFFVSVIFSQSRGKPLLKYWYGSTREFFLRNLLSVPTALLISILYLNVHRLAIFVFLFLFPFQLWATNLYLQRKRVYGQITESLVKAMEVSFPSLAGHSRRVADMSVAVAQSLGLTEQEIDSIELAALLHDIGAIGLDQPAVAPANHVDAEISRWLESHSRLGADLVEELSRPEITEIIRNHHCSDDRVPRNNRLAPSVGAKIVALAEELDSLVHGLFPFSGSITMDEALRRVSMAEHSLHDRAIEEAFRFVFGPKDGRSESERVRSLEKIQTQRVG